MKPNEIKAKLLLLNTGPADIARRLGIAVPSVSQIIHGHKTSKRVQAEISQLLGIPESRIWPSKKPRKKKAA